MIEILTSIFDFANLLLWGSGDISARLAFIDPATGLALGSAIFGGLFGGNKQKSTSNQNQSGTQSSNQRGSISDSGFQRQFENPLLDPARGDLLSSLLGELNYQQGPVFGANEIAGFLGNVNNLFGEATKGVTQNLAATGSLNSGRAAAAQSALAGDRASEITKFFTELPFREKQAQLERVMPLLNLGLGFVGRGTTDTLSGNTRDIDISNLSEFASKGSSTTTQRGGGGLTGLANLAGSFGLDQLMGGKAFPGLFGGWGGGSSDYPMT